MNSYPPHVRTIEGTASLRSRMLGAVLRLALREPLDPDANIAALRQRYEALDEWSGPAPTTGS